MAFGSDDSCVRELYPEANKYAMLIVAQLRLGRHAGHVGNDAPQSAHVDGRRREPYRQIA